MTAMSSFSHHHHHHHHPPPPPNGPLSVSPNLSGLTPSNTTSASIVSNNSSQQCLQQSATPQQHLQRDIISPSPYQCHMSVRHSPCSPSQGVASVYQMNGSSPASYGTANTPNGTTGTVFDLISYNWDGDLHLTMLIIVYTLLGLISPGVSVPVPVVLPGQTADMTSQYWSRLQWPWC